MEKHTQGFLAAGFFNVQFICGIEEVDLDLIGVKDLEERKLILKTVEREKKASNPWVDGSLKANKAMDLSPTKFTHMRKDFTVRGRSSSTDNIFIKTKERTVRSESACRKGEC